MDFAAKPTIVIFLCRKCGALFRANQLRAQDPSPSKFELRCRLSMGWRIRLGRLAGRSLKAFLPSPHGRLFACTRPQVEGVSGNDYFLHGDSGRRLLVEHGG
jgi:hypothetical protein